ncbi:MAG: XTP/dITP diphosphatase [Deltaproteobacteria bacterium]|jgi:XTP/dITP diphosphohydrolase|nr:XTP/dITP diphosphatase [Deltaproteobacteria bacterium]
MELVLATGNEGKKVELIRLLSGLDITITSLSDYPEIPEIVEDGDTFELNAFKKAREVLKATGKWVLADDSGLVVDALGGAPGVRSARYAGNQGDYKGNNEKLLREMKDISDEKRQARFVCFMALVAPDGREWKAKGCCEGQIARDYAGNEGFGFDPLFFIPEKGKTMAELEMDEKNEISHRGRALQKITKILVELCREN